MSRTAKDIEERLAAEEAEDANAADVAPTQRDFTTFEGFADAAVTPRELDGVTYADVE